ncbi:notch receptor protein [Pelomyxa schiedti]|nr:notch receptor protein [Pelomyxa schiedti]
MRCVIVLLSLSTTFAFAYNGWSDECSESSVGDGICNIECYSRTNNWDNGDCNAKGICNPGCNNSHIHDGICDAWCMTAACMFDGGDCTDLKSCGGWNCNASNLGDGTCDYECANAACDWDGGDCLYINCDYECDPEDIGNGWCDWVGCNKEQCGWDGGDCDAYCSADCLTATVGDGNCEEYCYVEECNWDGGDCDEWYTYHCSWVCTDRESLDDECDSVCYNEPCNWDNGACNDTLCSYDCDWRSIGNDICQSECNNEACSYDGGDCDSWPYVHVTAAFTDDKCEGEALTVDAVFHDSLDTPDCWGVPTTMRCGDGNVAEACITVDEYNDLLAGWFKEEPAMWAEYPTTDCTGTPEALIYWTKSDCILINNNLWGYNEWSPHGILVPHVCTDPLCKECFVQPDGVGIESYFYDCWSYGDVSVQVVNWRG